MYPQELRVRTALLIMQVEGLRGLPLLRRKVAAFGPSALFHGGAAATASSIISHYPWFLVYNTLDGALPEYSTTALSVARNAGIGLCAATAAACVSNWTRVIKTTKQTHATGVVSYHQVRAVHLPLSGRWQALRLCMCAADSWREFCSTFSCVVLGNRS